MPGDGLFSVNWRSPMLLGDEHLRLADECALEARRWLVRAAAPAVGAYGLAPSPRGSGPSLRVSHEHGADRLTVHVHAVSALAPDGTALVFDEEAYPELSGRLSAQATLERNPPRPVRLGVVLEPVDPAAVGAQTYIEVGEPDPEEDPPRLPLRARSLRLRVEPELSSSRSSLKLAEYLWDGVEVAPAEDYLPPTLLLTAWPPLARQAVELRGEITRVRDVLVRGASSETPEGSLPPETISSWLAAHAALEDGIESTAADLHPHAVWDTSRRCLRVARVMLSSRPNALEHVLKTFVQPGQLTSGNPNYFEDLGAYLSQPYDHDRVGPTLVTALELLRGLRQICEYLLGSAPVVEKVEVEHDVYFYKEKKYRMAAYGARVFELDEAWHTCFVRDLNVGNPKSLLLVCDSRLLDQNPRPNAGLWMLDKYERVKANMFRVNVDSATDPTKVVALFQEIGEPTVSSVSIASRGLLDLSGLGADPDEQLRIYYEE